MRQKETERQKDKDIQTDIHRDRQKKLHIGKYFDTFPFIREFEDSYELSLVHNSIN